MRWCCVDEEQIADAMRWAIDVPHLVVEGSGALGIAALRAGWAASPIDAWRSSSPVATWTEARWGASLGQLTLFVVRNSRHPRDG